MKVNWGTKLAFFALAFMAFIVTMVIMISRTDVPLVEEAYYEKGIQYQEQIQSSNNIDSLLNFSIVENQVKITNSSSTDLVNGKLKFYRPNDPSSDKIYTIRLDTQAVSEIDLSQFKRGKWKLALEWQRLGVNYTQQKEVQLK